MKSEDCRKQKKVSFSIEAEPGSKVFVAGSFNNWNPTQYRLRHDSDEGVYRIALTLPQGQHEYKFIVNDEWRPDPCCAAWLPNNMGTLNSTIAV